MKGRVDEAAEILAALAAEARSSPPPELDWERVEANLMRRVRTSEAQPVHSRTAQPRALGLWAAFAAAGLALGASVLLPHLGDVEAPSERGPVAFLPLDGDALPSTQVVEARDERQYITHRGRATWSLEPNGRASVLAHGDVITVRLLKGAIRAEVVPSTAPERFVIEAAETRVAVHGTVFRVELLADHNLVEVEEGVVAVGPIAGGGQAATILRAPSRAEFTPSGEARRSTRTELAQRKRPNAPHAQRPSEVGQIPESEAAAGAEAVQEKPLASELTIGEVEASVSPLVASISHCFAQNTEGSDNVRVTAQTKLTLDVAPDGTVTAVAFEPPLSPNVQACSEQHSYQIRFAPSEAGAKVTRVLELSR